MLKLQWIHRDINTEESFTEFRYLLQKHLPKVGGMDTETTGLHIVLDKPFVVTLGWVQPGTLTGWTFVVDLERYPELAHKTLDLWLEESKNFDIFLGQNLKFDIHMMYNIGYDFTNHINLADTQHYIRFAHDSLQPGEGGPPLGLKDYTYRFITHEAKAYDRAIQQERNSIAKGYNIDLKRRLGVTLRELSELFDDPIFAISDLPEHILEPYLAWRHSLPLYLQHSVTSWVETDHIRYTDVDRGLLIKYAHYDVKFTIEVYLQTQAVVSNRHQEVGLKLENELIVPFFSMERTGFKIDIAYLEESRIKLKAYIQRRRQDFANLADGINIGQHARIKDILQYKYGLEIKSSGAAELDLVKTRLDPQSEVYQFITVLQELRTLEKWYSAYITRFQKDLRLTDRLYTQINSVGAVSGRVTSSFQQFPKDKITDLDGVELFHPRKIVITENKLVYIDYSQIELRVQAFYTMLVGSPDRNMCRAYMPYECTQRDGIWYLNESPQEEWHEVDIHGATTTYATGLSPDHPDFPKLRSTIGKRVNFAKNYGAQLNKIREMFPDKSYEECSRINDAYYKAFPGVKAYHTYCERIAKQRAAVQNLFGISYYNVSGHKLKNLLVQGSAAYFLKLKILQIHELLRGHATRLQMQIHDELVFEWSPDDGSELLHAIIAIMEDWSDCPIPIVAETSESLTNWAEKKEMPHEI